MINFFVFLFYLISYILSGEDYYKLLGVSRNASKGEIKRAFKKLSLKYHPDKNKDNPEAAKAKFIKIANAYEVLTDDKKREIYNQFGEEGVKEHEARENAGQQGGGFPGGFRFNFQGGSFEDIFNQFFGGGAGNEGRRRRGGGRRFTFNTGGGGFHQQEEENDKDYFEQSDVINIKMNVLSKIFNRREGWFVLFYKPGNNNLDKYVELFKIFAEKTYGIFKAGAANCKTDEEICEEFSIFDTPKILFFPDSGKPPEEYNLKSHNLNIDTIKWENLFKYGSNKMQNFVRIINKDNYNDFKHTNPNYHKVLLFTSKKYTSPLYKAISKYYKDHLSFGEVRQSEIEICEKYFVKKFPTLIIITNEEEDKGVEFTEEMNRDSIEKFLNKYAYKKKEELKYTKINELKEDMYNKYNICKDGKNKCLIYFINQENLNDDEIKVLTTIGNKYINDHIKVYYINVERYNNFYDNFEINDTKNIGGIIIKGKRKRYLPLEKEKFNIKDLTNIIDNVVSGGGDFKSLKNDIKFNLKENKNENNNVHHKNNDNKSDL